jgi:F1F0 ATPase subunit 2
MSDLLPVLLALALGLILGGVFFGGLWWTVARGVASRQAALWFFVSMLLRTGVALLGFYLVARGSWQRLVVCLLGFVVARCIVTWFTADAPPQAQTTGSTSDAH